MALKKLRLKLVEGIKKGDVKRMDRGLFPIQSISALARELELNWPYIYYAPYTKNLLHRANKAGVKYPPGRLVEDIASILLINESEFIKWNTLDEVKIEPIKLKLKGNAAVQFKSAVTKISSDKNVIGFRKEILNESEIEVFRKILNHIDSPGNTSQNKKGTVRDLSK